MVTPTVSSLTEHYTREWFKYIDLPLKNLVKTSFSLYETYLSEASLTQSGQAKDYSFISFPMAIAYEGFLKQYLKDLGLIKAEIYSSSRFRIGRALNADIRPQYQDEDWLFDNLVKECSQPIARQIWETWLDCRNRVFHYFPGKYRPLTVQQAGKHLERMADVMSQAVSCQVPDRLGLSGTDLENEVQ